MLTHSLDGKLVGSTSCIDCCQTAAVIRRDPVCRGAGQGLADTDLSVEQARTGNDKGFMVPRWDGLPVDLGRGAG